MSVVVAAGADRERIAAFAPDGVELRGLDGDLSGVEVVVPTGGDLAGLDLHALPDLRLVLSVSAGTDWLEPHVPDGVPLCNARGERDAAMAEWVLGAVLGARTGLLGSARHRHWMPGRTRELGGARVVIVGMGSIGAAVRDRLTALGAHVEGVGRARLGELATLVSAADVLVELTPLTDESRGHIDAALLARLPDGALFVNAGRGATVDTDALLAELRTGRIEAVLDVVDPEPLPDDHPLWTAPGLLSLTSHWAGDSAGSDDRVARLVADQLRRYVAGEPLRNVVER